MGVNGPAVRLILPLLSYFLSLLFVLSVPFLSRSFVIMGQM